jgi:hypothetical protein
MDAERGEDVGREHLHHHIVPCATGPAIERAVHPGPGTEFPAVVTAISRAGAHRMRRC